MKIIGHRGAKGLAPENTISSLQKALDHHSDELEFDVRVTKDRVVILHHDSELTDAGGQRLKIKDHTYDELRQHKPDLARFETVLDKFRPISPLRIEVKPGEATKEIIHIINTSLKKDTSQATLQIASFDQAILRTFHKALPGIPLIVNEKWSGVRGTKRAREIGSKQLCMYQRWLWWGFIRQISRTYELTAYTVNNPSQAKRWVKHGLAGIVTDYPDRFERR